MAVGQPTPLLSEVSGAIDAGIEKTEWLKLLFNLTLLSLLPKGNNNQNGP